MTGKHIEFQLRILGVFINSKCFFLCVIGLYVVGFGFGQWFIGVYIFLCYVCNDIVSEIDVSLAW